MLIFRVNNGEYLPTSEPHQVPKPSEHPSTSTGRSFCRESQGGHQTAFLPSQKGHKELRVRLGFKMFDDIHVLFLISTFVAVFCKRTYKTIRVFLLQSLWPVTCRSYYMLYKRYIFCSKVTWQGHILSPAAWTLGYNHLLAVQSSEWQLVGQLWDGPTHLRSWSLHWGNWKYGTVSSGKIREWNDFFGWCALFKKTPTNYCEVLGSCLVGCTSFPRYNMYTRCHPRG